MAFESLLNQVGVLGRFQIFQMALLGLSCLIIYPHIILENFTAAVPDHRCRVQLLDNATLSINDTEVFSQDDLLKIFIPQDSNLMPEKCRRFVHPQWQLLHLSERLSSMTEPDTEPCMDGWVYDQKTYPSTIVTKWDLVCESQSLKSVNNFLFMIGMLIGGIILGYLTDRFGRKLVFRWCVLLLAIAETSAAFVPTFPLYCTLRFLAGCFTSSILTNSTMLIMEWVVPPFQALGIVITASCSCISLMILGGIAFAIRDWFILQLVYSVPLFFIFLSSRWLAESARWLIIKNKLEEGLKELKKVAHANGIKNAGDILTMEVVRTNMQEDIEAVKMKVSMFHLFRTPTMRKRTFLLCFIRLAILILFYGLALNIQYVGNNIFLSQVLFGVITLLGNLVGLFLLNHMGRRVSQMLSFSLVGIFILTTTFLPEEMYILHQTFLTLGIGMISAVIMCVISHANELMPTVVRATASGVLGITGNIGGALGALLMVLRIYSHHLPWILYGVIPILCIPVVFFLPETRNQPLPDSIQNVENQRKGSREPKQEDTIDSIKVTSF
ncbi:organic anion transporter 7-like isoform X2 [Sorex fumeus]|uniref:organic anion transporter 7-like isoform X2 n=1 Tax=Sorex fumeus TaxID=62283 RepID=UPI0024AD0CAC|nr:organic anion transporter 7-like isoform X2 [Sorex fumeus]XP_055987990.1 organic anion transporter 7-like isoform X2 [Sorex fumeus]